MSALNNISYGLYILSAKEEKNNACIINTLIQVTMNPLRISITINKDNYTCQQIANTGVFNVSILDNSATFDIIKHFGFSSGKDTDKFIDFTDYKLADNNIPYITAHTNGYISAKVIDQIDVGTHITFIADITEDVVLSSNPSLTYEHYLQNIKPKPTAKKNSYVCNICGYVYEGETLPDDFICPLCKHGATDFTLQ